VTADEVLSGGVHLDDDVLCGRRRLGTREYLHDLRQVKRGGRRGDGQAREGQNARNPKQGKLFHGTPLHTLIRRNRGGGVRFPSSRPRPRR
jgi:hypothetical protein